MTLEDENKITLDNVVDLSHKFRERELQNQGDKLNAMQDQVHFIVSDAYFEDDTACTFRMAQYPDGRKLIQGGYMWSEGTAGGFKWRDLPMVQVDASGNELP